MSNRKRLQPPPGVAAAIAAYRCGHCNGRARLRPRPDDIGAWHADVRHDDSCPVLSGTASRASSGLAAIRAAAEATGKNAIYIGDAP